MNSRELRSLEEEVQRLRTALELIAKDPGGIPGPRVFAADVLAGNITLHPSSSREAAAPPPTPKGLERWKQILEEEEDKYTLEFDALQTHIALSAIRRSVEEALVAATTSLEEWQPIETAPKEGRILGYGPDLGERGEPGITTIFWTQPGTDYDLVPHPTVADALKRVPVNYPGYWSSDLQSPVEATHWLPLPKPPKEAAPNV